MKFDMECCMAAAEIATKSKPSEEKTRISITKYTHITSMQNISGYWSDPQVFTQHIGKEITIPNEFDVFDEEKRTLVFATVLALCILRVQFSASSAAWKLVQSKAMTWLSSQDSSIAWSTIISSLEKLI